MPSADGSWRIPDEFLHHGESGFHVRASLVYWIGITVDTSHITLLTRCVQVLAAPLRHPVPTVGYVVQVRGGGLEEDHLCAAALSECCHSVPRTVLQ